MTTISIFLSNQLPEQYTNPSTDSGENPVADIDELVMLYANKYGSFGEIEFHIYDPMDMIPFIKALNELFEKMGSEIKVDARLLKERIGDLTPLIVVDDEIISRGVYPELSQLRGGENSVSRGGTGHHH